MKYIEQELINKGYKLIAGVDEAGRGCLAGPLVAASAILDLNDIPDGIKDSKLLSPKLRESLFKEITDSAVEYNIAIIEPKQIDKIGIQKANLISFQIAVKGLERLPDYILSDWFKVDGFNCPSLSMEKGEQKSLNIAAASILAKVYRDRIMFQYDKNFPEYGFASHKGYGTKKHRQAILINGPTPIHRFTFSGVFRQEKLI